MAQSVESRDLKGPRGPHMMKRSRAGIPERFMPDPTPIGKAVTSEKN